ncbi:unnamed protein product [Eruca vesicaria subsp. sativa]|uniref:Uncharacterized protein n=1 Tax=Eruca vesicaria subsp. sativa TaxID=29727 RepID=A0ABC8LJY0_ERUVS|nr:unnamed protein product [Eruca vesicaria subsp. sativa]
MFFSVGSEGKLIEMDVELEVMEENNNKDEEMQHTRSESFVSLSYDDEQLMMLGHDDELDLKKPLSEEEINKLISDLVGVESKAGKAQESLEKESIARVEEESREKLAKTLRGVELDKSVAAEMMNFRDVWESNLDNLETESANLLEQLDGAGIELPKLYKTIESRVPNGCCYTKAWKKRVHCVGTQVTKETVESLSNAETFLHTHSPVQNRHGELLEEGASGFLENKFADDAVEECGTSEKKDEAVSFGSKNWASVYLASTPQQAAAMGLEFLEVNEVEEIDAGLADTVFANAIENERELALAEEQKKNNTRVKEEDDITIDRHNQLRLKRKRCNKSSKQVMIMHTAENRDDDSAYFDSEDEVKCPETSTQFQNSEVSKEENGNLFNSDVDKMATITDFNADTMIDASQNTSFSSSSSDYSSGNIAVEKVLTPEFQKSSAQKVAPRLPKRFNRSRFVNRNCTRTAHQLTLISQGIKVGSCTVCGECGIVLTWENMLHLLPK